MGEEFRFQNNVAYSTKCCRILHFHSRFIPWLHVDCGFLFLGLFSPFLEVGCSVLASYMTGSYLKAPGESTPLPTQAPRGQIPVEITTQVMMGHATHRAVALHRSL